MNEELKGIGGWLLVLVIFLILGILNNLLDVISNFNKSIISSIIYLIFGIFGIIMLMFIFNKSQKAPLITIIYLWMSFIMETAMMLFFVLYSGLDLEKIPQEYLEISQNFILVISSLIIFVELAITILFTLYLIKSVRVKNTFN